MAKVVERVEELANNTLVSQRLATCETCTYKKNEICMSCNCIIESKVLVKDQVCPEGKW